MSNEKEPNSNILGGTSFAQIVCPNCKADFMPTRKWQKFCNGKCRTMHYFATHVILSREEYDALVKKANSKTKTVKAI